MAIKQLLSAPRSPWQRAYVERVIGTIRRECLDHLIVFNEASLSRHVQAFIGYYHRTRTHLALEKDTPDPRRRRAASSQCRKWAACITGTNAARLEQRSLTIRQHARHSFKTYLIACAPSPLDSCMPQVSLSVVHQLTLKHGRRQRSNNIRAAHHRSERARPGFPRGTVASRSLSHRSCRFSLAVIVQM